VNAVALSRIRVAAYRFLTERCDLYAPSRATLPDGTQPPPDLVASDVPCRVITIGKRYVSASSVVGGQESMKDTYRLELKHTTVVDVGYEVVYKGQRFEVIVIEADVTDDVWLTALMTRFR
jgi:hypothetical protein